MLPSVSTNPVGQDLALALTPTRVRKGGSTLELVLNMLPEPSADKPRGGGAFVAGGISVGSALGNVGGVVMAAG